MYVFSVGMCPSNRHAIHRFYFGINEREREREFLIHPYKSVFLYYAAADTLARFEQNEKKKNEKNYNDSYARSFVELNSSKRIMMITKYGIRKRKKK